MRTIQEILNVAMAEGGYRPVSKSKNWVGEGMCAALIRARSEGHIDEDEYNDAKAEVDGYVEEVAGGQFDRPKDHFLSTILRAVGMPYDVRAQRRIYKDWENRPRRVTPSPQTKLYT